VPNAVGTRPDILVEHVFSENQLPLFRIMFQAIEAAADGVATLIDQAGAGDASGLPFSTTKVLVTFDFWSLGLPPAWGVSAGT